MLLTGAKSGSKTDKAKVDEVFERLETRAKTSSTTRQKTNLENMHTPRNKSSKTHKQDSLDMFGVDDALKELSELWPLPYDKVSGKIRDILVRYSRQPDEDLRKTSETPNEISNETLNETSNDQNDETDEPGRLLIEVSEESDEESEDEIQNDDSVPTIDAASLLSSSLL